LTELPPQTEVVIAGAGPVGLILAIELGRRDVSCVLLEREPTTAPWPKMERCNARTMEIFRRMGVVDRVRDLGFPPQNRMDVFICTRLADEPLAILRHLSVAEARALTAASTDGSLPLEPYQLVSQNKLEPLLKSIADETPNVTVRYGCELVDLTRHPCDDAVTVRTSGHPDTVIRAAYVVGADGGRSTVRKRVGIPLEGDGGLASVVQVIFRSTTLYERIRIGHGRHYAFLDAGESTLVVQGDRQEFTLHTKLPADTDFEPVIRDLVGFDFDLEILHVVPWQHNLLVAARYRDGRVLLAGDSAHLVIPTGGLGMNTGVGDAIDLAWKLAATLQGWGGPRLLESYEMERRPVALRNREASRWAAEGVVTWRRLQQSGLEPGPSLATAAAHHQNKMHIMRGVELGYSYSGSSIIASEGPGPATWDTVVYEPSARPGARIPHMWLRDGRALQDLLGPDWTLLDIRSADRRHAEPLLDGLAAALTQLGAPLRRLDLDDEALVAVYGASLLLVRPDLHVAWRGDAPPADPVVLARLVTGHDPCVRSVRATTYE
jgi:2-polyprenyl-6-methoxyphenol hydroxylase-like FAD-dependent oxidoreductase